MGLLNLPVMAVISVAQSRQPLDIRCSTAADVPNSLHVAVAEAGLLSVKRGGGVFDFAIGADSSDPLHLKGCGISQGL